ncbi:MAG TPA: hypothetical protein VFN30_07260, partial [Chitinophagaceae bacterium]|nr:hypothetical protein [Chitinophagaceae bacterium]
MNLAVDILSYISIISVLIPIISHFLYKSNNKIKWILFALVLISLLADIGNEILVRSGIRGYALINTYFILQFLLLSYIFSLLLSNRKLIYNATGLYSALYLLFFVLGFEHFNDFQSRLRAI